MDRSLEGLRIVLVGQYDRMGGTRTYFKQLVDFYLSQQVHLLVVTDGPKLDPEMQGFLAIRGVYHQDLNLESRWNDFASAPFLSQKRIARNLQMESELFSEIARSHDANLLVASVGNPGSLLGALHAVDRSLYIVHTYPHGVRSEIMSRRLMPQAFPTSARLITVSHFSRTRIMKKWRFDRGNQNIDIDVVYSTVGPVLLESTRVRDSSTILTVGHLEEYKDPRGWIQTASEVLRQTGHEQTQFIWLGEGSLLEDCQRRVRKLSLGNQIHFLGLKQEVEQYYQDCAIYFQPSRVESLGLGVLDAARHGVPAVVTCVGGLPEVVKSGNTGVVYSLDSKGGAADAIVSLLKDPDRRGWMGVNSRQMYSERFSPQAWESDLRQVHLNALTHSLKITRDL